MDTIENIKDRAVTDMRQRLFERGLFRREKMKSMAESIARQYSAGLSPERLLALARHDTWLVQQRMQSPDLGKDRAESIRGKIEGFLRNELRIMVSNFWEARTSVEFAVSRSDVELVGFFNKERPVASPGKNDPFEEMLDQQQQAPYA